MSDPLPRAGNDWANTIRLVGGIKPSIEILEPIPPPARSEAPPASSGVRPDTEIDPNKSWANAMKLVGANAGVKPDHEVEREMQKQAEEFRAKLLKIHAEQTGEDLI
jgi:hypothetical protein